MMIGQRYSATAQEIFESGYDCASCGFVGIATASIRATAEKKVRSFWRDQGHALAVASNASRLAREAAELCARLARCPRCGVRSSRAISRWRRKYVWPGIFLVPAVAAIVAGAALGGTFMSGGGGYGLEINGVLGLVAGAVLGFVIASLGFWADARSVWEASLDVIVLPPRPPV